MASPLERVLVKLRRLQGQAHGSNVTVGYSAPYATHVHEDLEMHHSNPPGAQAKFLEQPARQHKRDMAEFVKRRMVELVGGGQDVNTAMTQALQECGDLLLSLSKELVPVDTGALRDSGYVKVDSQ